MRRFSNSTGKIGRYRLQQNDDGAVRVLVPLYWFWWEPLRNAKGALGADVYYYTVTFASAKEAHDAIEAHNLAVLDRQIARLRRTTWTDVKPPAGWP